MQMQNNSHCGGLTKNADERARQVANQLLWHLVAGAGGVGLVGGAGLGLSKMLTEDKPYDPDPSYQPVDMVMPKKKKPVTDVAKFAAAGLITKLAEEPGTPGLIAQFADAVYKHLPAGNNVAGNFFGSDETNPYLVPSLIGLGLPLAGGATYGGLKLGRGIVDWRRKSELDSKMKKTQEDYKNFVEQNLAHKHASDALIERELDELVELYEKQALPKVDEFSIPEALAHPVDTFWHAKNTIEGPYVAYALAAALGAGKLSYDYFKKRSPEKIQEQALRQRAAERYGGAKPIYLQPAEEGEKAQYV